MREGWKEVKFETLLEIPLRNGINRPSRVRGKGFKMVNMGELFANDRLQNIEMELVQLNASEQENFQIKNFDLLFARQSIVAEGAGKCSIVLEIDNINCFESHLIRARINDKNSALFYYYLFQSAYGKGLLSTIRQQGVQAGIRGSDLQKLKIICPPLETQRKIASILSGYDDLIENNLKRIKILEEMAQQTYEEWFVRMRFPGYESAVINKETGLPEGWEKVKLGEVAKINESSLRKGFKGRIKYIDIASVSPNTIGNLTEYEFEDAPNRARRKVKNGDIIWSCVRPNRKSYALIINPDENIIASTGFCVISPKKVPFVYLHHALSTDEFVGYLTNLAGGAAYPAVTQNHFEDADIIVPTSKLLKTFNDRFESSKYIIQILQFQNQRLREARDLLLPRLMMGIVEV